MAEADREDEPMWKPTPPVAASEDCERCAGTGLIAYDATADADCPNCGGSGKRPVQADADGEQ